jgi:hypothetical protein
MSELDQHAFGRGDEAGRIAAESARRVTDSARDVLQFGLGAQKAVVEELAQASGELLAHLQAEVEIASELVARVASSHSIRELASAWSDCAQHQADAFRRTSQLMMKHSQRVCERSARLLSGQSG